MTGTGQPEKGGHMDTVLARLRKAGLRPRKKYGQHFLHDPKILAEIAAVARLESSDAVLEVGTGPGTLTRQLALRAGRVLTVEVDAGLLEFAREELCGIRGIQFLRADALDGKGGLNPTLRKEVEALGPFKLVSNLPYSIATPLLLQLVSSGLPLQLGVVTVQRELASRLGARPSSKAYGPVTALMAFWATVESVRRLPAGAFSPPPEVTSEVIRILPRARPLGDPASFRVYSNWVHRLLSQRRKQLGGLLRQILGGKEALRALEILGLDKSARPDAVSPEKFVLFTHQFKTFI